MMALTHMTNGPLGVSGHRPDVFGSGRPPVSPLIVSWWFFAVSVGAFLLHYLIGERVPVVSNVLTVMSLVTCGLAWLLAQALFRDMGDPNAQFRRSGSIALVGILFALTLGLSVTPSLSGTPARAYVAILQSLIGSAVLFLTLLEAFDKLTQFNTDERRFRVKFAGAYAVILGCSFVVQIPEFTPYQAGTQASLAFIALIGAGFAVRYRLGHPLAEQETRVEPKVAVVENDPVLAKRIEELLQSDSLFLDPDVRLSDLARRLREPNYKVSRCITHDLDYRNFNHMMNVHRIAAVKVSFDDRGNDHLPILSIALDCGFGSIGPFNRAFKTQTGQTPSAYRRNVKSCS
jgi:AraC-like DNA-binding protein